jgi:uncharacterized protein YqeY
MTAADTWRATLRAALVAARKDRDSMRVSALRSALSAIDNAEAVPTAPAGAAAPVSASGSAAIAGGVAGLGATEVDRRELSDEQIRGLLRAEIDERLAAAQQVGDGGHAERAAVLRAEAAVLAGLLGDV